MQAVQVPVPSGDVATVIISTSVGHVLVFAAYDPNEGDERQRKARISRSSSALTSVGMTLYGVISTWWGDTEDTKARPSSISPMKVVLRSMLPPNTVTWEQHGKGQRSTIDVIMASAGLATHLLRCVVQSTSMARITGP
ncbi:hypothetical protein LTR49_022146 [Elasticomyces elasticus]|nr:hypothetical protein LTR49_022146 [Elasticomyces elasticus]